MTWSSFISILAPGTGYFLFYRTGYQTLTKILPRPHCHQRLPLQNRVIQTRSPSDLFSRVYPPGFPGLSFRGLPLPRLGLCPPHQLFPSLPVPGVRGRPSGGGSSSLTTSKFGLVSPVLRRCLSVVAPAPLPRPAPLHLLSKSLPLGSVPECPWESISLAWDSHLGVKLPFLHHPLRP